MPAASMLPGSCWDSWKLASTLGQSSCLAVGIGAPSSERDVHSCTLALRLEVHFLVSLRLVSPVALTALLDSEPGGGYS